MFGYEITHKGYFRLTPWYTQIWNAVLNEPFTVIGFLGVAFAWWRRTKAQKDEQDKEARQRDEERRLEISDIVQDALFLLDRVEHQNQAITRHEDSLLKARSTPPEAELLENRVRIRARLDKLREQLDSFDLEDTSHKNLLAAKKLMSTSKRLEAIGRDQFAAIGWQSPTNQT